MSLVAVKYVEHYSVATKRGTVRLSHFPRSSTFAGYWVAEIRGEDGAYIEIDRAAGKAGALVRISIWAAKGDTK